MCVKNYSRLQGETSSFIDLLKHSNDISYDRECMDERANDNNEGIVAFTESWW